MKAKCGLGSLPSLRPAVTKKDESWVEVAVMVCTNQSDVRSKPEAPKCSSELPRGRLSWLIGSRNLDLIELRPVSSSVHEFLSPQTLSHSFLEALHFLCISHGYKLWCWGNLENGMGLP